MKCLVSAAGLLVLLAAAPAVAQQVTLQMADGRVSLEATNASARQILAEWARLGGTTVVGAEKITGAPVTLKLVDVSERQALDIILRNVAGFIAAPRRAGNTGVSAYDRILVMATSTSVAPANATARPGGQPAMGANSNAMNGTQRRVPRPPNLPPSPAEDAPDMDVPEDSSDTGLQAPVFTFPQQGGNAPGTNQPVFVPIQNTPFGAPPQTNTPVITLQPGPNGPTIYNFVPNGTNTPAPAGAPPAGFGVVGAPTPGMIQMPAPPPAQPGARPPGE